MLKSLYVLLIGGLFGGVQADKLDLLELVDFSMIDLADYCCLRDDDQIFVNLHLDNSVDGFDGCFFDEVGGD